MTEAFDETVDTVSGCFRLEEELFAMTQRVIFRVVRHFIQTSSATRVFEFKTIQLLVIQVLCNIL